MRNISTTGGCGFIGVSLVAGEMIYWMSRAGVINGDRFVAE